MRNAIIKFACCYNKEPENPRNELSSKPLEEPEKNPCILNRKRSVSEKTTPSAPPIDFTRKKYKVGQKIQQKIESNSRNSSILIKNESFKLMRAKN